MVHVFQSGDPVPLFAARSTNNANFKFETAAGRYVVLGFYGSVAGPVTMGALQHMQQRRDFLNDQGATFFGVSIDPTDESSGRMKQMVPGLRHFWDFDGAVSRLYGAFTHGQSLAEYRPFTLILDAMLRVLAVIPLTDAAQHNAAFDHIVAQLPDRNRRDVTTHAPVLVLPRIFEPEFCKELIAQYALQGGVESGFMREVEGRTVPILDNKIKRRKDFVFDDGEAFAPLRDAVRERIRRRVLPEIRRAFQFHVTRIERYIVACYEADDGGFFSAHRDDTTKGTAHRKFACTLNLNAGEYEGGELRFPEFGTQTYAAPRGGAVVFSCSLLHEATPVTRGSRYAFLPFFYDEAAARIREENLHTVSYDAINKNTGS